MKLKNKVALVTGSGSGIGKAIAQAFAREGARLIIVDIAETKAEDTAAKIRSEGHDAVAFAADVSSPESINSLTDYVKKSYRILDILVNNAAIQVNKTVDCTTPEEWNRQIAVNVGGVFLCSRAFLPLLRKSRGVIISMSSVNAFFAEPSCAGYCATKAAILGLTKAMAIDHGREGVRVHAICPGYIDTGLAQSYFEAQSDPSLARAEAGALHALARIGRAEEVAAAAVFLASSDASFMTGSALIVDGGFSAGLPRK